MQFEPTEDMLAVMAEVQVDPRSKVFGRQTRVGAHPSSAQPLTGGEPFLTRAERKLIRAFREEYEYACYSRGLRLLCGDTDIQARFLNVHVGRGAPLGEGTRQEEAPECLARVPSMVAYKGSSVEKEPLDWLIRARALIERPSTVSLIGAWYFSKGRPKIAKRIFHSVLSGIVAADQAFFAYLNCAVSCIELGRYVEALELAGRAVDLEPDRVSSRCALLVAAAKCGRGDMVSVQDQELRKLVLPTSEVSVRMIARQYSRFKCASMASSAKSCGAVSRMVLGDLVREKCA